MDGTKQVIEMQYEEIIVDPLFDRGDLQWALEDLTDDRVEKCERFVYSQTGSNFLKTLIDAVKAGNFLKNGECSRMVLLTGNVKEMILKEYDAWAKLPKTIRNEVNLKQINRIKEHQKDRHFEYMRQYYEENKENLHNSRTSKEQSKEVTGNMGTSKDNSGEQTDKLDRLIKQLGNLEKNSSEYKVLEHSIIAISDTLKKNQYNNVYD